MLYHVLALCKYLLNLREVVLLDLFKHHIDPSSDLLQLLKLLSVKSLSFQILVYLDSQFLPDVKGFLLDPILQFTHEI